MVLRLIASFVILLVLPSCTSMYVIHKELKSEIEMAYYKKHPSFVLYDENNLKICEDYLQKNVGTPFFAGACEYLDTANYLFNINHIKPPQKFYYKRIKDGRFLSIGGIEEYNKYVKTLDIKTLEDDCYSFKNNIACYYYELANPLKNISEYCDKVNANKSSAKSTFRLGSCYAKLTLAFKENDKKLQNFYANKICEGGVSKYCDLNAAKKQDFKLLNSYNEKAFELCLNTGKNCLFIKQINEILNDIDGKILINKRCQMIIDKLKHIDIFYKDLRNDVMKEFSDFCESNEKDKIKNLSLDEKYKLCKEKNQIACYELGLNKLGKEFCNESDLRLGSCIGLEEKYKSNEYQQILKKYIKN